MKIENNLAFISDFIIDLSKKIGEGSCGKIFECISKKNNNIKYCAKIMTINSSNEKFCQREKEISEIIQCNQDNPNLVSVFYVEFIPNERQFVIIMERCDSNLQVYWGQKKRFNDIEIKQFIIQFLNGYEVLYKKNIIHKDIKPENILIKKQNDNIIFKIGDFGLAKIYKNNQSNYDISRNGTPAYSAPEVSTIFDDKQVQEQLFDIKNIMHAKSQIDIYSLGIILYQMIFGKFPFELNVVSIQKFFQTIKKVPLKITEQCSTYVQLVEKMLIYNPNERLSFQYLYSVFNQNIQIQPTNFLNITFQKFTEQDKSKNMQNNQQQKNGKGIFILTNSSSNENNKNNNESQIPQQQFQPPNTQFQNILSNHKFIPPQNPSFIMQSNVNPHQQIKDFLNYLICDLQNGLNDSLKQIINNVNQQVQINEFTIKQLQYQFPFEILKLNKYKPDTLKFLYSLMCLQKNPQCNQINISNLNEIKNNLTEFYVKRN